MAVRLMSAVATVLILALSPTIAAAWDGIETGTIDKIEITDGTIPFRVFLNPHRPMCTGGDSWAYLTQSHANYDAYVAAFFFAKANGTPVKIYSQNVTGTRCEIGYIIVQ
ncbi:MAG: hypothetical protein AAGI28_12955 [Pseudomonadota bacterium]